MIIIKRTDLLEQLLVGVITTNKLIIDVEPERAVPAAIVDIFLWPYESILLQTAVSFWLGSCGVGAVATHAANESARQHYSWQLLCNWGRG